MARQVEGPWYRQSKGTWYATIGGRKVSLGVRGEASRQAALQAWYRVMANATGETVTPPNPTAAAQVSAPTAVIGNATTSAVVDGFLADAKVRVKPNTLATYKGLLTPVKEHFGDSPA